MKNMHNISNHRINDYYDKTQTVNDIFSITYCARYNVKQTVYCA